MISWSSAIITAIDKAMFRRSYTTSGSSTTVEVKDIDRFDELVVAGEDEPGDYKGFKFSNSPMKGVNIYKYDA